jgi:AraC-like DNA-binding protein/ligand-binding sensor protein
MQATTTLQPASVGFSAGTSRDVVSHLQRSEVFRQYQDAFESTTGLPLVLRRAGSFQSPLHGSKRVNSFCALMGKSNATCAACLQLQQRAEDAATTGAQTLECFAGLSESVVPVRVGENTLGYLQTGQVMMRKPSKAGFANFVRQLGAAGASRDLRQLEKAYFQTRVMVKTQYDAVVRLVGIFAQHLSSLSNQVMVREASSELPTVTKARAFIAEHLGEELSLTGVARAVNMSGFYFCKIFKKETGLTFTTYVSRLRIEKVKELLLNPHTRVSEAAYAAGFQSLSQFNRIFRHVAGESPSVFRDRLHADTALPLAHGRALPHAA